MTGRELSKQGDASRVDEGDFGEIEHERSRAMAVLSKDVVARATQFVDPFASDSAREAKPDLAWRFSIAEDSEHVARFNGNRRAPSIGAFGYAVNS